MTYDNPLYWRSLHQAHPGSLKAVGHPWLCEALNELKYNSEAVTLRDFLNANRDLIAANAPLRVLDAGAGTGFWTELLQSWFQEQGVAARFTTLDLSEQALSLIKARRPEVETVHADLTTIDPSRFKDGFGLVMSLYCLHHLPRIAGFLNGLQFIARSVTPGGVLLLMDPVLNQSYSPFHTAAFSSHEGNGMPRALYLIDDVLDREGLDRIAFAPAISFLLNGSIQGRTRTSFNFTNMLWARMQRAYLSERVTRTLSPALVRIDAFLKRKDLAFSSSLVAYRKRP